MEIPLQTTKPNMISALQKTNHVNQLMLALHMFCPSQKQETMEALYGCFVLARNNQRSTTIKSELGCEPRTNDCDLNTSAKKYHDEPPDRSSIIVN